jgi:hypothetical protein
MGWYVAILLATIAVCPLVYLVASTEAARVTSFIGCGVAGMFALASIVRDERKR